MQSEDGQPITRELAPGHAVTFRRTPWDERAFGVPTSELLEVTYEDPTQVPALIALFDDANRAAGIGLSYTRCDAGDLTLKHALPRAGFEFVETSMLVSNERVAKCEFERVFRRTVELRTLETDDELEQIRVLARDGFEYSRFHEDGRIDQALSRERYWHWIGDLKQQERTFLLYKPADEVLAFMACDLPEKRATLVLGGSKPGLGYLSPTFWASVLVHLRELGYKRVQARVSAANVGVLRLYISLFFNIRSTDLGFNKIYNDAATLPASV